MSAKIMVADNHSMFREGLKSILESDGSLEVIAEAKAAEARGMEAEAARIFAAQSVLGAAEMVLQSSESPEQLRINVCSPGGTTIEAVNSLIDNDFEKIVREAFEAAVNRSIEMTGGTKK